MEHTTSIHRPVRTGLLLGTAVLVTLFLYFIDEGRYSLEGLFTAGNSIAMAVYLIGLFLGLYLMARMFAQRPAGLLRTTLVLTLGTVLGFVFGLLLIGGVGLIGTLG